MALLLIMMAMTMQHLWPGSVYRLTELSDQPMTVLGLAVLAGT